MNHPGHSAKAVQRAEIVIRAGLRKSELKDESCLAKDSGVTVHVIGRTKLPIGCAGCATGDTVKIALPSPADGVAHGDIDGIRHKTEIVSGRSHHHIKDLAAKISLSTGNWTSVLIDNADRRHIVLIGCVVLARSNAANRSVRRTGVEANCSHEYYCEQYARSFLRVQSGYLAKSAIFLTC